MIPELGETKSVAACKTTIALCSRALVEDAIAHALGLSAWWLLALRACHALAVGLAALAMYATLVQQIGM